MHNMGVFVLVQFLWMILIPAVQGHIMDDVAHSDECTVASQRVTVSGYYKTKPRCTIVDHERVVSRYKNELKRACHSNQCCKVTRNITTSCDGPVDIYIEFVLQFSCCCSAFTLRQVYCETQIFKVLSRIQNRGIMRLRLKRVRGKRETVKLFQKDVRLVATEAFCPNAYKLKADGHTCRPCPPITFTCFAHDAAPLCDNHGTCECGQCECDSGWSGGFCQCNNSDCPIDDFNRTCSGHGHCDCGHCHCDPSWYGIACECSNSDCPRSVDGHVCSGHGRCHCGQCICEEHTVGEACEICYEAITARNGSIHLSDLNVHHNQCTYSISSPSETDNVLVAVKFPNNQTCSHLEMTVSNENCTQGPDGMQGPRVNDSVAVQCSRAWFYSSKSNCLCIRVDSNGHTAVDTNLIDARFMTYDNRLSKILDFAAETDILDEFIQDDETWFKAIEFLCNPSSPVSKPEVQTLLSKLPQNLRNELILLDSET